MSNITYEEEFADMRTPLLKLIVLVLYILPVPILIFVAFDLFRLLRPNLNGDAMWVLRAIIAVIIAAFSWISSNGLYNLKSWAPKFTIAGFIVSIIGLLLFLFNNPEIYSLVEITNGILIVLIGILFISILIIFKNKDKFNQ